MQMSRAPLASVLMALVLLLSPGRADAQELLDRIRGLAGQNAEAYAEPVTRGLGHALSGGFMDRASVLPGLGFDIGVRVLAAIPTEEQKRFDVFLPDSVVFRNQVYRDPYRPRDGTLETPNIAGEGPGVVLVPAGQFEAELLAAGEDPDDYRVSLPGGLSLPAVPALSFHGSVGIGAGTQVMVHFLPSVEVVSEVGKVSGHGLTVHHALTHWFTSPVDLMVTGGFQEGRAGDFLETSAVHFGAMGGVKAGPMSFFGGALLRNASTDVTYRVELAENIPDDHPAVPSGVDIAFTTSAGSGPSFLMGARIQLLAMNLSGHYAFGTYDVFSLKLGLGLP